MNDMFDVPRIRMDLSAALPSDALKQLEAIVEREGRDVWNKRARISAVLDNCPKSKASMHSGAALYVFTSPQDCACVMAGIMHWLKYLRLAKGADALPFPVDLGDVLGWSLMFRPARCKLAVLLHGGG